MRCYFIRASTKLDQMAPEVESNTVAQRYRTYTYVTPHVATQMLNKPPFAATLTQASTIVLN
jgi:hypothetical protein